MELRLILFTLASISFIIALYFSIRKHDMIAIFTTIGTIIAMLLTYPALIEKALDLFVTMTTETTVVAPTETPTVSPTTIPTKSPEPKIVIQTGEISDSWTEILAAIDDGTAKQRYAVGAWKPLDLGEYGVINMQLAGFNLDERADGKGMAATTWIAKELLPEMHAMFQDWEKWSGNGWEISDLRYWLQNTVLKAFPNDLRNRLISVKKQQEAFDANRSIYTQTTQDALWIPSYPEVFGDDSLYYGLFENKHINRVKLRNGSVVWWWLRSANVSNYFTSVNGSGNYYIYSAHYSGGVALGFCL